MKGIYKITNPSGKVYIGQSVDINHRWDRYIKYTNEIKSQTKIFNSIQKYGIKNHKFEVLEECNLTDLNRLERFYQEKYNSVNGGLNCKFTTTDSKSGHLSEETKRKISKSNMGRVFTDDWKTKLSESLSGRTRSKESIKKQQQSRKNYKHSLSTVEKIKESNQKFKEVICPHCGKKGKQGMYRWHFDNCRNK